MRLQCVYKYMQGVHVCRNTTMHDTNKGMKMQFVTIHEVPLQNETLMQLVYAKLYEIKPYTKMQM